MKKCTHKKIFSNKKSHSNHKRWCEGKMYDSKVWKGDEVGYEGVHSWIENHYKKPLCCNKCKQIKKLELSNNSGLYKREFSDWEWICVKCHRKKDGQTDKLIAWSKNNTKPSYMLGKEKSQEFKEKVSSTMKIKVKTRKRNEKGVFINA